MDAPDFYFWEAEVNPHRLPLTRALARRSDVGEVYYVAQARLNGDRVKQGLSDHLLDTDKVVVAPEREEVLRLIRESAPGSVHVFSGMHWVPCIVDGLPEAVKQNRFFGLMSEPRVFEGLKGKLRYLHSLMTEGLHRKHAKFVAAIGRHGPGWFRMTGYGDRVFPFAYFVDPPAGEMRPQRSADPARLRIAYIGRLVKPKGFGVFLSLVTAARGRHEFVIAGTGDMAAEIGAAPNLEFRGRVPMEEISALMSDVDIVVVPSLTTDDGWAAVVSEALFAGAYPVVGVRVGASILADNGRIGDCVRADTPEAYLAAIEAAAARGVLDAEGRKARIAYAQSHLSGDVGAKYLLDIVSYQRGKGGPRPEPYYKL
ncbi:glycosyltransferase [Rhodobacter lacus]|uniref:Glycosyltransferase n=1 Tax=Rhodobacter lacus TaxID=1641972 RepID=A0ABW5ABU7_9RHOB